LQLSDKKCHACGYINDSNDNYCGHCGENISIVAVSSDKSEGISQEDTQYQSEAYVISGTRIFILTVATWGLYYYYWVYTTWKQIGNEVEDSHTPLLQTLSMLVPIYQLFRINKHVSVIKELAIKADLETELMPSLAVILIALNMVIGYISLGVQSVLLFMSLLALSLILTATVMNLAQETLNRYWIVIKLMTNKEMKIQKPELVLCALGLFVWANLVYSLFSV